MWLNGQLKQNTIKLRTPAKFFEMHKETVLMDNRGAVVNMKVVVNNVYS